jgi:hypothetical protein
VLCYGAGTEEPPLTMVPQPPSPIMNDQLDSLLARMQQLEKELLRELQRKETEFFYKVHKKKVSFTAEANALNRTFRKKLSRYLRESRFLVLLTVPVIWSVLLPVALLDLLVSIYQAICFPIYGIPKVRRGDYLLFDRHRLSYLNAIEKLNCEYCAYANGIFGYVVEVAGRTEQYWCPIRHALRIKGMHSRYRNFFDYGDAEHYRQRIDEVCRKFEDVT